jgi:hypothetical protein
MGMLREFPALGVRVLAAAVLLLAPETRWTDFALPVGAGGKAPQLHSTGRQ